MNNLFYKFSLVFFVIVFIGLVVITPVDTILQSQSSGQFWNVIITVVAYCLTVVIAIVLYILRLIKTRKSLADIPRRYIPRSDDVDQGSSKLIESELSRCERIVDNTKPSAVNANISHAGFLPPEFVSDAFDGPYDEVIEAMTAFLSRKAKSLHQSFDRPRGMAIREYLILLQTYGIFDDNDYDLIQEFVRMYEYARFSGRPLHQNQFSAYIEVTFKVLFAMKPPPSSSYDNQQQQRNDDSSQPSEFNLNLSRTSTTEHQMNSRTNRFYNPFLSRPGMPSRLDSSSLSRYHSGTPLSPFHSVNTTNRAGGGTAADTTRHNTNEISEEKQPSNASSSSIGSADGSVIIRKVSN